jgi:NAD-dependent dihydropyrimidine dehydrogenase PreA subunit
VGGPWVKPLTLRWVHTIRQEYKDDLFIAATNGAYDWRDIVQFIMTGAHIVEMCSAVMVHGYEWLGKQVTGLNRFMQEEGYEDLDQMRGIASDAALPYADMPPERAKVNPERGTPCARCLKACFYQAMQLGDKAAWVNDEICIGCCGCYSVCPVPGAIEIMIRQ